MSGLPVELYVILVSVALVALCWLLLRFGKIIARWMFMFGALVAMILIALTLLEHARATRTAVQAATVAGAGAVGASVGVAILSLMLLVSLVVICWLVVRLKSTERDRMCLLPQWKRRRRLPKPEPGMYYIVEDGDVDIAVEDLSQWGW